MSENPVSDNDFLNQQETLLLDVLKSAATLLGQKTEYREFARRLIEARKKAAKGQTKEARADYEIAKTKFPKLWGFAQILQRVYFEGWHNGAHEAGMRNHLNTLDSTQHTDEHASQDESKQ